MPCFRLPCTPLMGYLGRGGTVTVGTVTVTEGNVGVTGTGTGAAGGVGTGTDATILFTVSVGWAASAGVADPPLAPLLSVLGLGRSPVGVRRNAPAWRARAARLGWAKAARDGRACFACVIRCIGFTQTGVW